MNHEYLPRRAATSRFVPLRGLQYHLTLWGEPADGGAPPLWMLHGFMDVGLSFQFVVDAMAAGRCVIAPDWRGFGRTRVPGHTDAYWFPDYLADLEGLLEAVTPGRAVDLLGHSMGGNVAMAYAGVRPTRVRRLINLEGFGLPDLPPGKAPARMAQWLDELREPQRLKPYPSQAAVAERMRRNNPRLAPDHALWLAGHWAEQRDDGQWHLRADAAHRRVNPVAYRAAEAVAMWSAIRAPLLWVQGSHTRVDDHWQGRYSLAEFEARLAHVPSVQRVLLPDAGHMLHHDQPQALATHIDEFLGSA